ncbi:MAG: RecX family transcriptional regulator [Oscillospiraceae bacterium]|jgi:SOS response regulatory protein OraA/RecX|nr:RecX family transcriptional regulator [Oscillospiraceae bacterium]
MDKSLEFEERKTLAQSIADAAQSASLREADETEPDEPTEEQRKCVQRALRILGFRSHGVEELRRKLKAKGESSENSAYAVNYLLDKGLLDDESYGAELCEYYRRKGYPEWRVKAELRRHLVRYDR